ncbi:site-specific integrase [Hyphomicrobium sp. 99]|uniref:tyrosine-type recombinase/integrase n=1 Tax=Hyphomicrobium sp. 99 TaxID=1163419 RepID=UPI000697D0FC|nr:site-specific integrase [Hyphomicrobium sp. 99]
MAKLTRQAIEKAYRSRVVATLWDADLRGFAFRISPKGKASWLVKRRLGEGGRNAKQILFVFGEYPVMDLDAARTEALKLIASIAEGVNPQNDKRRLKNKQHEAYANGKLRDVFQLWFEKHAKPDTNPPKGAYWYEVRRRFNVEVIPKLGSETLVGDITRKDITALIDNKERITKSGARQVFNAMRPFFKWCLSRDIIPIDPMDSLTPPERYQDRDRVLTDKEIVLVWSAASDLPYPWGPYFKLLLLTLQRRDEVAQLPWSELDLARKHEWIIPGSRTKNGREHLVHLSGWAVNLFHSMADKAGTTYCFTTKKVGDREFPISGFSKAKAAIDAKIKKLNGGNPIPPWRVHDLRRTGATGLAGLGIAPHITERILNHISGPAVGGLTGIYQRFEFVDERREALRRWANHINDLLLEDMRREREANNVVILRA